MDLRTAPVAFSLRLPVALLVGVIVACAPSAAPSQAPGTAGTAAASKAPSAWDQIVAAATKEGKVVVYGSPGTDLRDAATVGFTKQYPGIQLEYTSYDGSQLSQKLLQERGAGLFLADVINHAPSRSFNELLPEKALEPLKEFLVGPNSDPSKWINGKLQFTDKAANFNLAFAGQINTPIAYNTSLYSGKDFKSWKDLLDPKWKGKVSMNDPRSNGPGQAVATFIYYSKELGPDFLKRILTSGVMLSRDDKQILDWVARKDYPVAIGPSSLSATQMAAQGLPVELIGGTDLKEGAHLSYGNATISVPTKAPHPNAARVYIDWLLSKDTQSAWSKATGNASLRTDASKEGVKPGRAPLPGVDYFTTETEATAGMRAEVVKFVTTILGTN